MVVCDGGRRDIEETAKVAYLVTVGACTHALDGPVAIVDGLHEFVTVGE